MPFYADANCYLNPPSHCPWHSYGTFFAAGVFEVSRKLKFFTFPKPELISSAISSQLFESWDTRKLEAIYRTKVSTILTYRRYKMPLSKSLSKVQKKIKGSGKQVAVHPKGRKYQQLVRATMRESKVQEKKRAHNEKRSNELARVKFIQDVIKSDSFKDKKNFSYEEAAVFIEQFINRDDPELEQFKKKQRSNRPTPNRQLLLEQKKKLEMEEFKKGFLCPDLADEQSVVFLRNWNGTFGAMSTFKMIRINNEGKQVVGGHNKFTGSENNEIEMA